MATCKRCGKRTMWTDASGYCEKCHDELYVAKMKRLAGDDSPEAGKLYKWQGPFRQVSCRLCGSSWDIEPRTGYCKECIKRLEGEHDLQRRAKAGDEDAIRRIQEREAISEGIHRAAEEGRLGEVVDILLRRGAEEDEIDEGFEDFEGLDEADEDDEF